jgi:hypothetical protein
MLVLVLLCGCAAEDGTIGPDGGTLTAGPVTLEIPAGALDEDVTVMIEVDPAVEAESEGLSDIYAFTPHGLTFAEPAVVTFEHDPGEQPMVKWSDDGRAWSIVSSSTTTAEGTIAEIEHFSWGYVAEGADDTM